MTVDVPPREAPVGIKSLVVGEFDGKPKTTGAAIAQALENRLLQEGAVQPVRSGSDTTLNGGFQLEGVRTTRDRSSYETTVKENGKKKKQTVWSYTVRKTGRGTLSYSLKTKGQPVAGNTFSKSFDKSWSAESAAQAAADALSDDAIDGLILGSLIDEVVAAVSPHREARTLPLRGQMNPDIAKGIDYLQSNRFDQAIQIWQHVVDTSTSPGEKAQAYYDIGVIREVRGEYQDAFLMFSNADALDPGDRLYIEALSRVEKRQKESQLLDLGGRPQK